ncbi:unnamed protein product [Sphagnum jensenii]|uniref:Uncharacterized protein n=1 Tax=Sphagnum jensenii TaxID=128206 RepID=A0ABP0VTC8_9BRYO
MPDLQAMEQDLWQEYWEKLADEENAINPDDEGNQKAEEDDSSVGLPPQIPPLGHLACLCSFMATMLVRL